MRLKRKLYYASKKDRPKRTVFGQSERCTGVKLKGQGKTESGRSGIKLDTSKDKT